MPVATKAKSFTLPAHALAATQQVGNMLGVDDLKALSSALIEAAAEALRRDSVLAERVRHIYGERAQSKIRKEPTAKQQEELLIPRKQVPPPDSDPTAPPDPYYLYEVYGEDQLARALRRYKLPLLVRAAERVTEQNPDTKPTNKSQREPVIDYIVHYVTK